MTKQKVKTEQLTTAMKTPGEQKLTMKETLKRPQEGITKTIPSLRGGWELGQAITNSNKKTVTLQPTLQLDHPPPPAHYYPDTQLCVRKTISASFVPAWPSILPLLCCPLLIFHLLYLAQLSYIGFCTYLPLSFSHYFDSIIIIPCSLPLR